MHLNIYVLSMSMHMHEVNLLTLPYPIIMRWRQGRSKEGSRGGHLPHLAPLKKSINISSIILYNTINAFKNYIIGWFLKPKPKPSKYNIFVITISK